jgi:uncharacterized membrane protein (DUF485 family)
VSQWILRCAQNDRKNLLENTPYSLSPRSAEGRALAGPYPHVRETSLRFACLSEAPDEKNFLCCARACAAPATSQSRTSMPPPTPAHDDVVHSESFLRLLMRRQLSLSITSGVAFLGALLALPLFNYYAPALMATRVAGFTLTWLILGVLFFPLVWIISWIFIKRSIALEEEEVAQVQRGKDPK